MATDVAVKDRTRFLALVLGLIVIAFGTVPAGAVDLSQVSFNGYLDLEYSSADNTEGNYNSSFHQHHLSFLLDIPVSDRLSAYTHIEFDHGTNISTAPTAQNCGQQNPCTSTNAGDVIVENAYIRYALSDAVQFRFGRMLTPFGYYNEIHDATPAIISIAVPRAINATAERGGSQMFPQWNTGVAITGTVPLAGVPVDYVLYTGNGENPPGWNDSQVDANTNKAAGGRVSIQALDFLQLGASLYSGDKAVIPSTGAPIQNLPHTSEGFLLSANGEKLFFLSEYAISWVGGSGRATSGYGQASYHLLKGLSPYYRFEYTRPNESVSDNAWVEQLVGLNIRPVESENLIFKMEYSDNKRGANNTAIVTYQNYRELRFAVTLFF